MKKVVLPGPDHEKWPGLKAPPPSTLTAEVKPIKGYPYVAVARKRELQIYGSYGTRAWVWGKIRQGRRVPVRPKVAGKGCRRGRWYESTGASYICNTHGYTIIQDDLKVDQLTPPRLTRALPYAYFKATKKPTLRFSRVPTPAELKQARGAREGEGEAPEVVDDTAEGAYFFALDGVEKGRAGTFYRSIGGDLVYSGDATKVKQIPMHGELLGKQRRLPLAFVHKPGAPVWCLPRGTTVKKVKGGQTPSRLRRCGKAERHARFSVARKLEVSGDPYVLSPRGYALPRAAVRVAERIRRPKGVSSSDKWVHFDLSRQTMVAYEGARPVMATLISSGKEGHDTPAGSFRVYLKHVSTLMKGDDPKDGPYDIGEVPWVMYYKSSYAVHGAYWHNTFGNVRSHGCTNLAPADARWLFFWSEPDMPRGWHTRFVKRGTLFHYTS